MNAGANGSNDYFWAEVDLDARPARVSARGELDSASAGQLGEAIDQAWAAGGEVALDMSEVSFMDSSGLRALTTALRRSEETGRAFHVTATSEAVRRVLEMTGLTSLLET